MIARNWRHSHCEVDLIMSKGAVLHFVEVKTKSTVGFGFPEAKVNRNKLSLLKKAAAAWLELQPQWKLIQFDIVSIQLRQFAEPEILLIEDVF